MSWHEVLPAAEKSLVAPVSVVLSKLAKNHRQFLIIKVRSTLLPALTWWHGGAAVRCHIGEGEHAHLLRVQACREGKFVLSQPQDSDPKMAAPAIKFLAPKWIVHEAAIATPLDESEFRIGEDFILITLPKWARRPEQSSSKPVVTIGSPKPQPAQPKTIVALPAEVQEWARGMNVESAELDVINEKRRAYGLPAFVVGHPAILQNGLRGAS